MAPYWTEDNRPENHPLWAEQVRIETFMRTSAADDYRALIEKHQNKKAMSELTPFQRVIVKYVRPLEESITSWRESYQRDPWTALGISKSTYHRRIKAGEIEAPAANPNRNKRSPIAITLPADVPSDVLALLTLRTVLDRMTDGPAPKVPAVAIAIGTAIEHEARILAWQQRDREREEELKESLRDPQRPEKGVSKAAIRAAMRDEGILAFEQLQQNITNQKATSPHRKRVNINRFNKQVKDEIGWASWTDREKQHVGFAMIDHLITTTGRFRIESEKGWRPTRGQLRARPYVLVMDDELESWISKGLERASTLHPVFMPTVIPPKDWSNMRDGGYHTDLLPQRTMIRFKTDHEEQRGRATFEMGIIDMPRVYSALNTIQSVPWRINRAVYEVAAHAWKHDSQRGRLARQEAYAKPTRTLDFPEEYSGALTAEQRGQLSAYKKEMSDWHGRNAKRIKKTFTARRVLGVADAYKDKVFYFPHILDFRGRTYPIPADLHPQGEDLARGLLTFAEGKPLTKEGADWLAIQVCNTYGNDKVPFEKRVEWTVERNSDWLRIAADPLGNHEWDAEGISDPWQHLAAIIEWARYLKEGLGMLSSLPVRVDGTCNGIQHLSAMIRDEEGGASVNLVPGDAPRDIYLEVAALVQAELERLAAQDEIELDSADAVAKHDHAVFWLHALGGVVPRTLTKRPVMILPYGGTREAYFKYTMKWLEENDSQGVKYPLERRWKLARFITNVMWAIVRKKLEKAISVQRWLENNARLVAEITTAPVAGMPGLPTGSPLLWTTPLGFVVRHFYGTREETSIETKIDGKELQLTNYRINADLDIKEQLSGVAPNFTHSMDAAALMRTIELSASDSLAVTVIHDAFGAVASDVPALSAYIRQAFVELYRDFDPLGSFLEGCKYVTSGYGKDVPWKERPEAGSLDIVQVLDSKYFFA